VAVVQVVTVVGAALVEMARSVMLVQRVRLHLVKTQEVRGRAPWAEATEAKTRALQQKAAMAVMVQRVVTDRSNRSRITQRC
jgi:hypothetical protein